MNILERDAKHLVEEMNKVDVLCSAAEAVKDFLSAVRYTQDLMDLLKRARQLGYQVHFDKNTKTYEIRDIVSV